MINYAQNADRTLHRVADLHLIRSVSHNPQISRVFKADQFNTRFVARYWMAWSQEFESLTQYERFLPLAAYYAFRNIPDQRIQDLFPPMRNPWEPEARYREEPVGDVRREYEEVAAKYDLVRPWFTFNSSSRLLYELGCSPEYYMIKTVFFIRYAARMTGFVPATVKTGIRNMIDRVHRCGLISLIENHENDSPEWEKDKALLISQLETTITSFRVKYGRSDVSLKEYWGV